MGGGVDTKQLIRPKGLIERANGWKLTAPLQVCNMWCFKTASFKMHTFIPLFPLMTLFLKLNHDEVSVTL